MSDRDSLRAELLGLIETHKEGFASGTPEAQRIDALIDALAKLTPYPNAMDYPEIWRGQWVGTYHNIGGLVGGKQTKDQGIGFTTSLHAYSMKRLPDIPARFDGNVLEVDPDSGAYNFHADMAVGAAEVPTDHYTFGRYKRGENPDRFYVEFESFAIRPKDPAMSLADYAKAIGVDGPEQLQASMDVAPKLYSTIVYMDDDMRIQLGQLGGHYILRRTGRDMVTMDPALRQAA